MLEMRQAGYEFHWDNPNDIDVDHRPTEISHSILLIDDGDNRLYACSECGDHTAIGG